MKQTQPFAAVAAYRPGQPLKIVAQFDDRNAAEGYVERAQERYFEVILVEQQA